MSETKTYRMMPKYHVRNKDIQDDAKVDTIATYTRSKRLNGYGHNMRRKIIHNKKNNDGNCCAGEERKNVPNEFARQNQNDMNRYEMAFGKQIVLITRV